MSTLPKPLTSHEKAGDSTTLLGSTFTAASSVGVENKKAKMTRGVLMSRVRKRRERGETCRLLQSHSLSSGARWPGKESCVCHVIALVVTLGRTAAPQIRASATREGEVDVLHGIPTNRMSLMVRGGGGVEKAGFGRPLQARNTGFVRVEHNDVMPGNVTSSAATQPVPAQTIAPACSRRLLADVSRDNMSQSL